MTAMFEMFEHHRDRLLPLGAFLVRLARFALVSSAIIGFSLGMGAAGYHAFGGLPWIDSVLNAAMILTGMGPVDRMITTEGKLFATFYALYSGLAFITTVAIVFAPILHRLLHSLHLDVEDEAERRHAP